MSNLTLGALNTWRASHCRPVAVATGRATQEETVFQVLDMRISKLRAAISQNRWANLVAGTLLLLLALWIYHLHVRLVSEQSSQVAAVPRLRITDFKPIYERWTALADAQTEAHSATENLAENSLYVIDVRPSAQYSQGHIHGAVSIPEAELGVRIKALVPASRSTALIVLYCA